MKKIFLLFFILSTIPVLASEDFNAFTQYSNVAVCGCGLSDQKITVQNTGDIYSNYLLTLDEYSSKYGTILPNQFTLMPGEQKIASLLTNAPCNTDLSYTSRVNVQTDLGLTKTLSMSFDFNKCSNIGMSLAGDSYANCACKPIVYAITLQNIGSFTDTYNLGYSDLPEGSTVSFSQNPTVLNSGETNIVYASVTLPCSYNDLAEGKFIVVSSLNEESKEQEFLSGIISCYNTTLDVQDKILCVGKESKIEFTLGNAGRFNNTYNAYLTGAKWASLKLENMYIQPDAFQKKYFSVTPDKSGDYSLTIKVNDKLGIVNEEKKVVTKVTDCYSYQKKFSQIEQQMCPGMSRTYKLNLTNTGTKDEQFGVYLDGPSWGSISKNSVTLQPNETKQLELYFAPSRVSNGDFILTIFLDDKKEEIPIKIDVPAKSTCYSSYIVEDTVRSDVGNNSIRVTLKNNGTQGAWFNVSMKRHSTFSMSPSIIWLWPNEKKNIYLWSTAKDYGNYNSSFDINVQGLRYYDHLGIKIEKENYLWIPILLVVILLLLFLVLLLRKRHEKAPELERIKVPRKLKSKKIVQEPILPKILFYILAFFLIFILFFLILYYSMLVALFVSYLPYVIAGVVLALIVIAIFRKSGKLRGAILFFAFLMLVVLSILLIISFSKQSNSEDTFVNQTLVSGREKVIDLSSSFFGEPTSITVSGNNYITVKIQAQTLTLSADQGWYGTEKLTISAIRGDTLLRAFTINVNVVEDLMPRIFAFIVLIFVDLLIIALLLFKK